MKKHLLFVATLLTSFVASAQFTDSNAPVIGDGATLYVLDSNATAYNNQTGTSAEWDYSTTSGYDDGLGNAQTKLITVIDASTAPQAADFPASTHALEIQDVITQFYTDDAANGRVSQGLTFEEPSMGTIVGRFDTDEEQLITYPFSMGDAFSDAFSGTADAGAMASNLPVIGSNNVTIDGKGTLKLGQGQVLTDVLRYKLTDTMSASTPFGNMQMVRTQYEYYKHGNSITGNLPLFIHVHLVFLQVGSATPIMDASVVLSGVEPDAANVGITTNQLAQTSLYPNPANAVVTVQLPNGVEDATITISDALGRTVYNRKVYSSKTTIAVDGLKNGLYFAAIKNNNVKVTKRLIIK